MGSKDKPKGSEVYNLTEPYCNYLFSLIDTIELKNTTFGWFIILY